MNLDLLSPLRIMTRMATRELAPAIRTTIENFVRDLQRLLASAVIDAVRGGSTMAPPPAPPRRGPAATRIEPAQAPAPRGAAAASKEAEKVHTFDDYERAALQRALGETGEDRHAAAKLLGASKSTMYRRLKVLGIRSSQVPPPLDIGRDLPLDLFAYEGRAVARAIEAANGHKQTAAKLIGSTRSSFYRATDRHGLWAATTASDGVSGSANIVMRAKGRWDGGAARRDALEPSGGIIPQSRWGVGPALLTERTNQREHERLHRSNAFLFERQALEFRGVVNGEERHAQQHDARGNKARGRAFRGSS